MSKDEKTSSSALVISGALLTNKQQLASFQKKTAKQLALIVRVEGENVARRLCVGLAFHVIKESLDHGEWGPWKEAHVLKHMSERQVHYMMAAAAVWLEKARVSKPEVAALPSGNFSLKLKDGASKKLAASAVAFAAGRTWGELLDEEGIKDGAPPALGGARKGAAKKGKTQSAEQLYLFARDEIGTSLTAVERVLVKENMLQHMVDHPEEVAGVVESLRTLADKVEKAAKPLMKK